MRTEKTRSRKISFLNICITGTLIFEFYKTITVTIGWSHIPKLGYRIIKEQDYNNLSNK